MVRKYSGEIDSVLGDRSSGQAKLRPLCMQVHQLLDVDRPVNLRDRRPFHWALEFPEVFTREGKGFNAIVGNPPFKGGQGITGALGRRYREYLVNWIAAGERGSADLAAYFFLRAFELLRNGGNFGLLAVNTISEGDTRQIGLEKILKNVGSIYSAHSNEPWPGQAAVATSRIHVHKGKWAGRYFLGGKPVETISAFLSDHEEWSPKILTTNLGKCFQGSLVLGMGFVLTEQEGLRMIEQNARNKDVLFPFLGGEDLNSNPEKKPSRWVINFWDWPQDLASTYIGPYEILREKVKPERERNRYSKFARENWWLFERVRAELYHAIGRGHSFKRHRKVWTPKATKMESVVVTALHSKHGTYALVTNDLVFQNSLGVFPTESYSDFALLSSCFNTSWVRKQGSTLETRLRYTPSDCFETFPFPVKHEENKDLTPLGQSLDEMRSDICRQEWIGLTDLYNRFHDPKETGRRFQELREIQVRIDQITARAYRWDDIDLAHDFHEVAYLPDNDRLRFTISETAREEIVRRLYQLNKERYEEEVRKEAKSINKSSNSRSMRVPYDRESNKQWGLRFETGAPGSSTATLSSRNEKSDERILAWLSANPGWHGRDDILKGTGIDSEAWKDMITHLLKDGKIEKTGQRRGTKYREVT